MDEQLELERVKEILQTSANPYINGAIKSGVRDHWEKFCREYKFLPPNSRYVKLEGLFDLLFVENNSPRFLMHNFTTSDLPIRMLQEGQTLHYGEKPEHGLEARGCTSFSLHGCGRGLYDEWGIFRFCHQSGLDDFAKGFVIFNDQFYEKICSRDSISSEELTKLGEILDRIGKLNEDDFKLLGQIIKSVEGKPFSYKEVYDSCRDKKDFSSLWPFSGGIEGMLTLRKEDFYQLSNDTGLRAVEITRERDCRALPITPEDVRYLIEFDNSQHQIDYRILDV